MRAMGGGIPETHTAQRFLHGNGGLRQAVGSENKYKGKKALIVGMGKSGVAALELMSSFGADMAVYDAGDPGRDPRTRDLIRASRARGFFGRTPPAERWDYIVMSPGVPSDLPFVTAAVAAGATLTGDLELAYELDRGIFIAITGTNGKTTTTALVGEMFRNAGIDSAVTGNIGEPAIRSALQAKRDRVLVTEVSSFQLETTSRFRPKIAAILNITPDHLDRHGTMECYGAAKAKVFANQRAEDFLIYNRDDEAVCRLVASGEAAKIPFSRTRRLDCGAFAEGGRIFLASGCGVPVDLAAVSDLRIPGVHNLENALAAAAIAHRGGVDPSVIAATLAEFRGVAHRMEPVDVIDGIRFVNDSKGTNPDASVRAIAAAQPQIVLIAGGYDKQADFRPFIRAFGGKVSHLLLIGQTADALRRTAEAEGFRGALICADMEECVERGFALAEPGDTVLLSPACASWDMYGGFEERGDHFKRLVGALRARKEEWREKQRDGRP
ncbi:MAG: UDP-N-acetylmuramoyl-L-alanine--D-glutamate ligase [Clostridiales Family XIII bacterium]|jgi:UDP-N-acetylmuramoylalanine--D-glutamate ligase|nr:UDP-N-acetylmuramoyl-L-alanine--D-glutamate ligase [Clostridiales Family XIII bacterium]